MQVEMVMSRDCRIVGANDTIQSAAEIMAGQGIGCLPVGEDGRLVGMLTDRDIVIRCVAQGKDKDCRVRDAMTRDVKYCYADEMLTHVLHNMAAIQVRRIPVMDRHKHIVGILSLSDASRCSDARLAGAAFCAITTPGGSHAGDQMKERSPDGDASARLAVA